MRPTGPQLRSLLLRLLLAILIVAPMALSARAEHAAGAGSSLQTRSVSVTVASDGAYSVVARSPAWMFAGNIGHPLPRLVVTSGADRIGAYQEVAFSYQADGAARGGAIRAYLDRPVVLFTTAYQTESPNAEPFPTFTAVPKTYHFSWSGDFVQQHQFSFRGSDSPWIFFDAQTNTAVLSPASHFLVAQTRQVGAGSIASGIDPALTPLPAGYAQQTMLVFGVGINATISAWGHALTDLAGKTRPANDADPFLARLSYWTDRGAAYWYAFDHKQGSYPATLLAVRDEFERKGLPLGAMQLDSWWYGPKSKADLDIGGGGGILLYQANPSVWREPGSNLIGSAELHRFQQQLGLPTMMHARWIAPDSPYWRQYDLSGRVAIDPRWWDNRMAYIEREAGAIDFEQDWLNAHAQTEYNLTDPEAFFDQMARATSVRGIGIQYCQALVGQLLQASRYSNVTTTRVSGDRFGPTRWEPSLWGATIAQAVGVWPWVDVFMSRETDNLLLANLSAGPVGTGDALGTVDAANLRKVVRADGVIVKPDVASMPIDAMFIAGAQGQRTPMVAATHTDFGGTRVSYVTAFARPLGANQRFEVTPAALGMNGSVYVYRYFTNTGTVVDAHAAFTDSVRNDLGYYIVAPVTRNGYAFLGDAGKFVSLGRQRISQLTYSPTGIRATIAFADGETALTMRGYARSAPVVTAVNGTVRNLHADPQTGLFTFTVSPGNNGSATIQLGSA